MPHSFRQDGESFRRKALDRSSSLRILSLRPRARRVRRGDPTTTAQPHHTAAAAKPPPRRGDHTTTAVSPRVVDGVLAPETSFPCVASLWWIEEIARQRTSGDGQVVPGGTLRPRRKCAGVLTGVADIGLSCPTYEPGPSAGCPSMTAGLYTSGVQASLSIYEVYPNLDLPS